MIIHFQLNYLTQWGEHIAVEIDGNANQPVALSTEDGQHWETTVKLSDRHAGQLVTYRYSVWRGHQRVRQERGAQRHIIHAESQVEAAYFANDNWRDLPQHNALFSLAFQEISERGIQLQLLWLNLPTRCVCFVPHSVSAD